MASKIKSVTIKIHSNLRVESLCKSLCKNLHASFLRGFFVEIRHIAHNFRTCKCCNAHGLYCSFVLLYFDFWTILVHGSCDNSSHFVHGNINILTHTTSGPPVVGGTKLHPSIQTSLNFRNFAELHLRSLNTYHFYIWPILRRYSNGVDGFSLTCTCQKLKKLWKGL